MAWVTPVMAEWTCEATVRRQVLPDGRVFVVTQAGPDNCGRAELIAVLHNCLAVPISVHDVLVTVRGTEAHDEGYWVPWGQIAPDGERRLVVEPRGVGVVTVIFRIEREGEGALQLVEARAAVRKVVRTTYE